MDADHAAAPTLSGGGERPGPGPLRIGVRRARPDDRDTVLAFATSTFEGWDYIPEVWDEWLEASDGVCLVAVPLESDLPADRPIAFSRVALLSPAEAWLEGIRVDPAVRGRSVATALQVSELHWAAAQGASVVRYTTGQDNEGSHRLGARHGFVRLRDRRSYGGGHDDEEVELPALIAARRRLLHLLADAGLSLLADSDDATIARWWSRVEDDATFAEGDRLYEWRPWTFQQLTAERFALHVREGAALTLEDGDEWALALVSLDRLLEGQPLALALLVGSGRLALSIPTRLAELTDERVRFRLPDPDPLLLRGISPARSPGGFTRHARVIHLLARGLDDLPAPDSPDQLVELDPPEPIIRPPAPPPA